MHCVFTAPSIALSGTQSATLNSWIKAPKDDSSTFQLSTMHYLELYHHWTGKVNPKYGMPYSQSSLLPTTVPCKTIFFQRIAAKTDSTMFVQSTSSQISISFFRLPLIQFQTSISHYQTSSSTATKVYRFYFTRIMEASATNSRLESIANNTYFVLNAYFFAFFPWAVMHVIDFISEKCRTVRQTRKLAHTNMLLSMFPCFSVEVYTEAQRQNNNSKELGAATAALMFNVVQLLRTLMGNMQLEAFVTWCKHSFKCMRALQGAGDERAEQRKDVVSGYDRSDANNVDYIEDSMKLNNTIFDNELGVIDVTVFSSWKKTWKGLKKGVICRVIYAMLAAKLFRMSESMWRHRSDLYRCGNCRTVHWLTISYVSVIVWHYNL